jgi:ActR/RegA family two-component response regulator
MPNRKRMNRAAFDIAVASLGIANITEARLDSVEVRHIKRVLAATDGNISLAAKLLGMPRRTLQRKMRRMKPSRRKVVRRRKHGGRR